MAAINDQFIFEFLNDRNYRVDPTGIIYTCVDLQGRVSNNWRAKRLTNKSGYLSINYKRKSLKVHRIIYCFVHKDLNPNLTINHIDGNPSNNNIANLEQVSQSENNIHRFRVLKRKGVKGFKKITQEIANEIRRLHFQDKVRACDLVRKFKLAKSTIHYILKNITWNPLTQ